MKPTKAERARLRIVTKALLLSRAMRALELEAYTSDAATNAEYTAVLATQRSVSRLVSMLAKGL